MWRRLSVILALGVLAVAQPQPAEAATQPNPPAAAGPVIVVGIPDLRWEDLSPSTTPTLWKLVERSAAAAMTDDSGEGVARRATGWLTLNSGSRAAARVPAAQLPDPSDPHELSSLRERNAGGSFAAQVGALGDALRGAGLTTAAVGTSGAVLGVMAADGTVGAQTATVAEALSHADVVTVELPGLYDADRQDAAAVQAARSVDDGVAGVLQQLPSNASLIVVGVSDAAAGPARLHVALATGPAFRAGVLTSASTGRPGVVQLIDVAPTILWLKGVTVPSWMVGVHWQSPPSPSSTTRQKVAAFAELDQRSVTVLAAVSSWYYRAVAVLALVYALLTVLTWARGRTRALRPLGAMVAAIPIGGYLMQLVPWWRAGAWLMAPLTLTIAALIGGIAAFTPWLRRGTWRTAAVVGGVTAAVVVLDAATGSPLSLDGPFADNPIIAGRFTGIGNVALSLLGAGTLLLSAALATRLPPRKAGAMVAVLGLLAVVVVGSPGLGDKFGGILALVPAVAILALGVSGIRISWRHVTVVLAATVAATAAFVAYDYSRPVTDRTHLGRFLGQLTDGTAETVILRKLHTSLGTFTWGYGRWIALAWVLLAAGAYLLHRLGRLRLRGDVDRRAIRALTTALVALAFLGTFLNDSGVEVTAFSFYLAAPLLVPLLEVTSGAGRSGSAQPGSQAVTAGVQD